MTVYIVVYYLMLLLHVIVVVVIVVVVIVIVVVVVVVVIVIVVYILDEHVEKWLVMIKKRSRTSIDNFDILKAFACSPFLYGEHVDMTHWTMKV